jgi:lipid-A-disaccharide synthase
MSTTRTIVLVCGETSGDMHAATLVQRLCERIDGVRILAMGGERCREAGADVRFDYHDYAILGFTGVLANLFRLWKLERGLKRLIDGADLFVAVDYPGLNLRLAAYAKRRGVPVLYYISPQVWAWGAGRVDKMKKTVDRLAVILPFEEAWFRERGMDVEYVGHPFVVDHPLPPPPAEEAREGIGVLPGSRVQEVERILPAMLEAAGRTGARPVRVARSANVSPGMYDRILQRTGVSAEMDDDPVAVMGGSRVALVASGTATLQTALMGTPLVVVYRINALNYLLARRLITIDSIGLVNVALGERVAPELIQGDATPERIAEEAGRLLADERLRRGMRERFVGLRERLGGGEGCRRVADIAAELLS